MECLIVFIIHYVIASYSGHREQTVKVSAHSINHIHFWPHAVSPVFAAWLLLLVTDIMKRPSSSIHKRWNIRVCICSPRSTVLWHAHLGYIDGMRWLQHVRLRCQVDGRRRVILSISPFEVLIPQWRSYVPHFTSWKLFVSNLSSNLTASRGV